MKISSNSPRKGEMGNELRVRKGSSPGERFFGVATRSHVLMVGRYVSGSLILHSLSRLTLLRVRFFLNKGSVRIQNLRLWRQNEKRLFLDWAKRWSWKQTEAKLIIKPVPIANPAEVPVFRKLPWSLRNFWALRTKFI